jgi:hypothetical protein
MRPINDLRKEMGLASKAPICNPLQARNCEKMVYAPFSAR